MTSENASCGNVNSGTENNDDSLFMARALELAKLGWGRTSPNPAVGAVIVQNDRIIGEGYHLRPGTPHAEINALNQAGDSAKGATLYVNLEPCSHYGRTPPCADAIIKAGLRRVVAAMTDPNPLVAGKGLARLREAGIEAEVGLREDEARRLNEDFIKYIVTGMPFVAVKAAMTLDGKIAAHTGDSRWVTGEHARQVVHGLRDRYSAVLVGIGTVLADDPQLTTRLPGANGRDPIRIIVDSRLRIPETARVLHTGSSAPTWIACARHADPAKQAALERLGAKILEVPEREPSPEGQSCGRGLVDMSVLLRELGRHQVTSILVEGGSRINASLFEQELVDKFMFFIAPKLVGGDVAPGPIGGGGKGEMASAVGLERVQMETVGEDFLISGYPVWNRGG